MTYYNSRSRRGPDADNDSLEDDLSTEDLAADLEDTVAEPERTVDVPAATVGASQGERPRRRRRRPRPSTDAVASEGSSTAATVARDTEARSTPRTRPSENYRDSSTGYAGGYGRDTGRTDRAGERTYDSYSSTGGRERSADPGDYYAPSGGSGGRGGDGGGNYGGYGYARRDNGRPRFNVGNITVLIASALIFFFGGFALRDVFTANSGFDDERPIQAQQVPANLREFCVAYNGYPSFTLINVTTTSALTATSVPVLRLNTCTIPTKETANALQALGVQERSVSVGLQLGGSNLTLVNLPLADTLARQFYARYPGMRERLQGNTDEARISSLEVEIAEILTADIEGLALQNLIRTNKPNVYAIAPGHVFNLQPNIGRDFAQ